MSPTLAVCALWGLAIAGVGLGLGMQAMAMPAHVGHAAAAISLGLLAAAWRRRQGTALASGAVVLCVMVAWTQAQRGPPAPSPQAYAAPAGPWRVVVVSPPEPRDGRSGGPAQAAQGGDITTVRLVAQVRGDLWQPEQGVVRLHLRPGPAVARGDQLQLHLGVRPLRDVPAPWQQSAAARSRTQHVSAQATVCGMHTVRVRPGGCRAQTDAWRHRAAMRLTALLPQRSAAVARALALGDTQGLTPAQRDAWADAGMAHLLAVSGLHVGLVARLARGGAWRCMALYPPWAERISIRRAAAWVALPSVWAYAVFTGAAVSAQRAAWMATLVLGGEAMGRGRGLAGHNLGLAGLGVLAVDPLAVCSPGFWLSFVSVGCLLGLPPTLRRPAHPADQDRPSTIRMHLGRLRRAGLKALGWALLVSGAAAVATAPLSAYYFGRISLVSPYINLIAVPLGSAVATPMAIALAACAVGLAPDRYLVRFLAWATAWVLQRLDSLAVWAHALPWAALTVGPWHRALCVVVSVAWGLYCARAWAHRAGLRVSRRAQAQLCGLCCVVATAWACGQGLREHASHGRLTLWHLDVGQGDATLIGLPDGSHVLVDAGGAIFPGAKDPGRYAVGPALLGLGIHKLRAVVLTHPHPDHMGGLAYVLGRWPVQCFWRNAESAAMPQVQALEALVRAGGGEVALPPPSVVHWGGAQVRAHLPLAARAASANDHSIVLELSLGARRALLMGDAEAAAEADVLPDLAPADVLKLGHHGSRTSTTQALLQRVRPSIAVISCGEHNSFGHPHAQTLARLDGAGIMALRTDILGTVSVSTDGTGPWAVAHAGTAWAEVPGPSSP